MHGRSTPPSDGAIIGIYGAGGMGRDTAFALDSLSAHSAGGIMAGFIDDSVNTRSAEPLSGLPRWPLAQFAEEFPGARFIPAVGDPATRRALVARARSAGLALHGVVDARALIGNRIEIGAGVVICAGSIITTDVHLGEGVQVNISCTITHDCRLGDYVTLSPGARLSGNTVLGAGVFVGTSAVFFPGVTVGAGARVAAGAVVKQDVPPGVTVAGVPARIVRHSRS